MSMLEQRNESSLDPPVAPSPHGAAVPLAPAPIDRRSLNLPNAITLSRLILAIVLFTIIGYENMWLTSAALFVFGRLSDGSIAYKKWRSAEGWLPK